MLFERWGEILKNRRAKRLDVYRGFMNKCDKRGIENMAQQKIEKTENEPTSIEQMTFKKTLGPNDTVIAIF